MGNVFKFFESIQTHKFDIKKNTDVMLFRQKWLHIQKSQLIPNMSYHDGFHRYAEGMVL